MNLMFPAYHFRKKHEKRGPDGGTNRVPISFRPLDSLKNVIRMIPNVYPSFGPKMVDRSEAAKKTTQLTCLWHSPFSHDDDG